MKHTKTVGVMLSLVLVGLGASAGCSNDTSDSGRDAGAGQGGSGTGGNGSGTGGQAATGGTGQGGAGGDGSGGMGTGGTVAVPCDGTELTVHNILAWCSVTVGDNAPFTSATKTVCVPEGATDLSAVALDFFKLGDAPWHDTDGDAGPGEAGVRTGSGQDESSAVVATVSGDSACVWVCCPHTDGTGCNVVDPCP